MKRVIGYAFLLLLLACASKDEVPQKEGLSNNGEAIWIGDGKKLPAHDSLFYKDDPAPLFRKDFHVKEGIRSARLYITAAGYYKASINGKAPGKERLDPAWTDYSKRIYYSQYDITEHLRSGSNCIGVALGNGFYNPLPLRMWGSRNLRNVLTTGRPVFLAKMVIEYANGETEMVVTDDSWRFSCGPVMRNSVFLGEVYDARKEINGWDQPGFDASSWEKAVPAEGPGGKLQKAFFPPFQLTERIPAVEVYSPQKGVHIADMGENFSGIYRIRLKGNPGDTVTFRFGERIYADGTLNPMTTVCGQIKQPGMGGPGAPDTAWQTDTYIFGKDTDAWYQPSFTFHTYRYMEIAGLEEAPASGDITGLFLHSDVPRNNHFSCSSDLLNAIQEATRQTFRANLISVQSDCPARERFGYGGDLNAVNEAFICNFDMKAFYRKTVYDWLDAMNDSVFVDTAPFVGIRYCGLSWESAFLITQYYLYLYYNDVAFVEEMYEPNKKWMEKAATLHPDGWVREGLGDHESLTPVPVELTGTCHYLSCARIMKTFAAVMEDAKNEAKYRRLAEKLEGLLRKKYWEQPVEEEINKQTLFANLLYYDIVPPGDRQAAADSLLKAINKAPAGHFTTGIFGTKHILEALSEQVSSKKVFQIVNSTGFPGWGFMVENGATTLWETWKESENTYSNCHPMFGSVSQWFYQWLGGIRPDPQHPGFEKFYLSPATPEGLEQVNCTYHSPFGRIHSSWKKENNRCTYRLEIPEGTTARVNLAPDATETISIEKSGDASFQQERVEGLQTGRFELAGGKYTVIVK